MVMKAAEIKDDFSIFWEFAKGLIFMMGILLFFMGWIYLNSFLSYFGLTLNFIKIDFTTFYFYGFFVLIKFWSLLFFLLFFFFYSILYYHRDKLAKNFYLWIILVSVLLFGVMFMKSKSLGAQKAGKILYKQERIYPIRFNFKGLSVKKDTIELKTDNVQLVNSKYVSKMLDLNYKGKLYFLFENNEEIIVFHNPNIIQLRQGLDKSIEIYKIRKEIIDYYYLSVDISYLKQ
jgi:hypothetical protein